MKILFLTYSFAPNIGGIESHSLILATELAEAGYKVCLMTMTKTQEEESFPFRVVRSPGLLAKLKWFHWADMIFENNLALNLSLSNWWFRRPRITAIHTWISRPNKPTQWMARFKQWWLAQSVSVIVVSKPLQRYLDRPTEVIPNPYQNEVFRRLPKISKSGSFVFLGRLVSDKGLHLALEAIQLLVQSPLLSHLEKYNIRLTVIGDGPQKEELIQYSESLGISEKVDFVGVLKGEALAQKLNEHEFSLVPSIWKEPFGMVALETMACGCIPIVADTGGLPDAIGDAGLLFRRGSSNKLAEQMIRILEDNSLREKLRSNALKHLARHTSKSIAARYIAGIEKFWKENMNTQISAS